jgi:hypothetical protein
MGSGERGDDGARARAPIDPLASACAAVGWVVVASKPFYPIYFWWLVGGGVEASLVSLLAAPIYAAAALAARRASLAARVAMPTIGLVDTLLAAKIWGLGSGAELFLFSCGLLAALSFRSGEGWWSRGLIGLIFVGFVAMRLGGGPAWHAFPPDQLSRLLELNTLSAASLFAFIGLRFAGVARQ